MLANLWLPAGTISRSYAVHEAALFRYSQRGMLGARWDAPTQTWLYDMRRVRELFVPREASPPPALGGRTLGRLGEVCLAGAGGQRRQDAREARLPLHVGEPTASLPARWLTRAS